MLDAPTGCVVLLWGVMLTPWFLFWYLFCVHEHSFPMIIKLYHQHSGWLEWSYCGLYKEHLVKLKARPIVWKYRHRLSLHLIVLCLLYTQQPGPTWVALWSYPKTWVNFFSWILMWINISFLRTSLASWITFLCHVSQNPRIWHIKPSGYVVKFYTHFRTAPPFCPPPHSGEDSCCVHFCFVFSM